MLEFLKQESNQTTTENGAFTYKTTNSDCLDFFSSIGGLRQQSEERILGYFQRAWAENPNLAIKILFFGRDVRGGLGERRIFRIILNYLCHYAPETVQKNITYIPEYGRFDDLLTLLDTPCRQIMIDFISKQLQMDILKSDSENAPISLLAKWLPSVNASSKTTRVQAKRIATLLNMKEESYRHMLTRLRKHLALLENHLREKDYTFSYETQPSKAMYKYRKAFIRNDGERYRAYITQVAKGTAKLNTSTLYPYDIIAPISSYYDYSSIGKDERKAMDATWNALPDFTTDENALVVIDGSGSMYQNTRPSPASVALSLGIYFAERNKGMFHNHFITFSEHPKLVQIKGNDIVSKVQYCASYNEVANTNLQAVFTLILNTAVKHKLSQADMPQKIYIISDMEFDCCTSQKDITNFQYAKQQFESHGYQLPNVIFWNVASRNIQQPVTMNEQGVALVSGCTPKLFEMVTSGVLSPYYFMMDILHSPRYKNLSA